MSAQRRTWLDFVRKLAAVLLVLTSITVGIVGLGFVTGGDMLGLVFLVAAPAGVLVATRITPEAGSSGYCDRNL